MWYRGARALPIDVRKSYAFPHLIKKVCGSAAVPVKRVVDDSPDISNLIVCRSIVLFYLGRAGFYIAVAFVARDEDALWRRLAARQLEGRGDGAVLEQAFPLTQCYGNYHHFQPIDKIVLKKRLKHIRAAEYVQVRPVRFF